MNLKQRTKQQQLRSGQPHFTGAPKNWHYPPRIVIKIVLCLKVSFWGFLGLFGVFLA